MDWAGIRGLALGALLCFGSAAGWAQDIPAARVNGVAIDLREVEAGFADVLKEKGLHLLQVRNPAKVKQMKHEVLDRLIDEELLWQAAEKAGQVADERAIDDAFAAAAESAKGADKLRLKLAQEDISEAEYRERVAAERERREQKRPGRRPPPPVGPEHQADEGRPQPHPLKLGHHPGRLALPAPEQQIDDPRAEIGAVWRTKATPDGDQGEPEQERRDLVHRLRG